MSDPSSAHIRILPASLLVALAWMVVAAGAQAQQGTAVRDQPAAPAEIILHMLDYVGVDYAGAVKDGKVLDQGEYDEQLEFVAQARVLIGQLDARPERATLAADADRLVALVKDKRPGPDVATLATQLRWAIIKAYGVEVAPKRPPDLAQAGALYASQCALCHGPEGRGDGAAGKSLDPPPANFHDAERMAQRSVYSLYSTITLGVGGTGMTSFRALTDEQRWALAFYVATLGPADGETRRGAELWQAGRGTQVFPDLASLVTRSAREVHTQHGADAAAMLGYLQRHPELLTAQAGSGIVRSAALLHESLTAYRHGRGREAQELAAASYLDGFELAEAGLDAVNRRLSGEIETEMMRYRGLLRAGAPLPEVEAQAARIASLLDRARGALDSTALSASATFLSAFVILLREGLEAILVVAAIYALLVRAGRRDALAYLQGGWIVALIAGALTWLVAAYVAAMSGATREVTEGLSALIAAAILLYVGFWMHGKSQARQWQAYLDRRLEGALTGRTLWALAFVSFLAVYREAFETVLFYEALAMQAGPGGGVPLLAGLAAATGALLVLGWLIIRGSVRLPFGLFFGTSAALLALLSVILAGKGVAALQAAGWIAVHAVRFPSLPLIGLYPNLQSLLVQAALLVVIASGFVFARRGAERAS
jgi:high-affinity iron transporter